MQNVSENKFDHRLRQLVDNQIKVMMQKKSTTVVRKVSRKHSRKDRMKKNFEHHYQDQSDSPHEDFCECSACRYEYQPVCVERLVHEEFAQRRRSRGGSTACSSNGPSRSSSFSGLDEFGNDNEVEEVLPERIRRSLSFDDIFRSSEEDNVNGSSLTSRNKSKYNGSHRIFLKQADVQFVRQSKPLNLQERRIFLLPDNLIITKRTDQASPNCKLKQEIPLNELWLSDKLDHIIKTLINPNQIPFTIDSTSHEHLDKLRKHCFVIGWPNVNYVLNFSNQIERNEWFKLLKQHAEQKRLNSLKNKLSLETINLRVTTRNLYRNTSRAKYVAIRLETTAEDAISKALSAFQIFTSAKEYNLQASRAIIENEITDDNNINMFSGMELPFCYWTKAYRESLSIYPEATPSLADIASRGLLAFEQLKSRFHYVFELKRFDRLPVALGRSTIENISSIQDIGEATSASDIGTLASFWKMRLAKKNSDDTGIDRSFSKDESNMVLFGDKTFDFKITGTPEEIWLLLRTLHVKVKQTLGIFRKPASAKHVRELKIAINQHFQARNRLLTNLTIERIPSTDSSHVLTDSSISCNRLSSTDSVSSILSSLQDIFDNFYTAHALTGTLKEYLRCQEEPILTFKLYNEWVKVGTTEIKADRINLLGFTINQRLDKINQEFYLAIILILSVVCEHRSVTNMSPKNCAISLAPSLIWHPSSPEEDVRNVGYFIQIVEDCIIHKDKIFSEKLIAKVKSRFHLKRRGSNSDAESMNSTNSSGVHSGSTRGIHKSSDSLDKQKSPNVKMKKPLINRVKRSLSQKNKLKASNSWRSDTKPLSDIFLTMEENFV